MIQENQNMTLTPTQVLSFEDFKTEVLNDYKTAVISRECSLLGRVWHLWRWKRSAAVSTSQSL
jgi:hypothetical protein